MYKQTRVTLKNALETFENILKDMQTDLEKYANNPKYNERVAFFKRSQIHNLQSVCIVFAEFANDANNEIEQKHKEIGEQKLLRRKLEGALLIHGVPAWEINRYYNKQFKHIENEVAWCYYKDKVEYKNETLITKPQTFKIPLLVAEMLNGRTGFETPEPIKITDKPIIPFKLLKEHAETGTCSDKTFMVQLKRA